MIGEGRAQGRAARAASSALVAACALWVLGSLAACGRKAQEEQQRRLVSPVASERADAAGKLGALARASDDEAWVSLEKATRDPAPAVRLAAAHALAGAPKAAGAESGERGGLADDAVAALLSDRDEGVRIAAAGVLGQRCGPRPIAYLEGAFGRGGSSARAAIAGALLACGVQPAQLFGRVEHARRRKAEGRLDGTNSAQRAWAARELGLLGRDADVQLLRPLLDDRDGAVVAAAAEGLGHAGAGAAVPRLARLIGDPVPLIAGAAAQALAELGPEACRAASAALEQQAQQAGEQALPAALALVQVASAERLCASALEARAPAAAALLARGCPAGPIAAAFAEAVPGGKSGGVGSAAAATATVVGARLEPARASALLEALLQARAEALPAPAALALGRLAGLEQGVLSERAAEVAGELGAKQAGPALLAIVRHERLKRARALAARRQPEVDTSEAASELALQGAQAPDPDREKFARLMKLVQQRNGQVVAREGASERLAALLRGDPPAARRLLALVLRASLLLQTPGAAEEAAALAGDPDREVAAAARTAAKTPAPAAVDGPAPAASAPAPAAPAAEPEGALAASRAALWSEDGAERAAACQLLGRVADGASGSLRAALAQDPEQRVRAACSSKKETAPPPAR